MSDKVKPCKYAYDPEDDFCSKCNGVDDLIDEGVAYPVTQCGGYEPLQDEEVADTQITTPQEVAENVEQPGEIGEHDIINANLNEYTSKAVVTSLRAESGVTVEFKDKRGMSKWYKFGFIQEVSIPEDADIEQEKIILWNEVNRQVDQQLIEISEFLKN